MESFFDVDTHKIEKTHISNSGHQEWQKGKI
jgi:hypothetical protein